MPITSIFTAPRVGQVGAKVTVLTDGVLDYSHECRFYIESAPASSSLLTLANYAARFKERKDARMKLVGDGSRAELTCDVPGVYTLVVYDVTVTRPVPHFAGEVLAGESDNELTGAPTFTTTLYVAEDMTFGVGASPDTSKLKIVTVGNRVATAAELSTSLLIPSVTLTAGSSPASKIAVYDSDVLTVLDDIAAQTSEADRLGQDLLIGWGVLYLDADGTPSVPGLSVYSLVQRWNEHLLQASPITVHGASDAGNQIVSADPTDLATCIALLNEGKTKYEAHRVNIAAGVHGTADTSIPSVVTASDATDFASAVALWADLWSCINYHGTRPTTVHGGSGSGPVDGAVGEQVEAPRTLLLLIDRSKRLKSLYNGHVTRTATLAAHANADTDNTVSFASAFGTVAGVAKVTNDLAASIRNHAQNLKPDSTAATSAYHDIGAGAVTDPNAIIPFQASESNPESIVRTLTYCLRAMQEHGLNVDVHGAYVWGNLGPQLPWPYHTRLSHAWANACAAIAPVPPENFNRLASIMKSGYGATLSPAQVALRFCQREARRVPVERAAVREHVAHLLHARVAHGVERLPLLARVVRAGAVGPPDHPAGPSAPRPTARPRAPALASLPRGPGAPRRATLAPGPSRPSLAAVARLVARAVGLARLAALAPCGARAGNALPRGTNRGAASRPRDATSPGARGTLTCHPAGPHTGHASRPAGPGFAGPSTGPRRSARSATGAWIFLPVLRVGGRRTAQQ